MRPGMATSVLMVVVYCAWRAARHSRCGRCGGADGRAGEAVVRGGPCDAGGEVGAVGIGGGWVAGVEGGAEDFGLFQDELEAEWAEEGGEGVDDADGVRWLGRGDCGVVLCVRVLMGGGCEGGVVPKDCYDEGVESEAEVGDEVCGVRETKEVISHAISLVDAVCLCE